MVSDKTTAKNEGKQRRLRELRVDGITAKQERVILALLHEPTIQKASQASGAGLRTVHRWLTDPAFSSAYRRARREAFGHSIALAQQYAPLAVNTLIKGMTDADSPHHVRVSAASTLLKFGREGIEIDDLAARIEALEQLVNIDKSRGSNWSRN